MDNQEDSIPGLKGITEPLNFQSSGPRSVSAEFLESLGFRRSSGKSSLTAELALQPLSKPSGLIFAMRYASHEQNNDPEKEQKK